LALQLLLEEIHGNDFQKNEQAQKGERWAMRGHGTGIVKWLGIILQGTGGWCKQKRNVIRGTNLWWL